MKLLQHIEIPGTPSTVTAQQKGVKAVNGHVEHYTKDNVAKAKRELMAQLMKYKPSEPYTGPLCVRVIWRFSRDSWQNKAQKRSFRITKPDLDNLIKGCADVMTSLHFWEDDNCISIYQLSKIWNKDGGLLIDIYELTPEDYDIVEGHFKEIGG